LSTNTSKSKAAALAQVQALIAGTQKHFPTGSFTIGNTTYTSASLVQTLQGLADTMAALNAAQTGAKDALVAKEGAVAKVGPVVQAYRRLVLAAFANATQTLADFGITAPKARVPLTVEEKAAAAAKAKATRAARGTTSKKQKLAITGNVTGVSVTPITAPTAVPSVASAAPAPAEAPVTPATPSAQPVSTTSSAPILLGPPTK
jgi:hypothetical protein